MLKAKIFISHSTETDLATLYLKEVAEALDAEPRFEALLDQKGLRGGDNWRERLYTWMDQAHGAVILLSREALQSTFVPIEVAVLSFRNSQEQKFPIIPILIGDVQPSDTEQGTIGAIDLSRIQFVRGLEAKEAAQEVLCSLRSFFQSHTPRTRLELLEGQVARHLVQSGLKEHDLVEIADTLEGWLNDGFGSRSGKDIFLQFSHSLLRTNFELVCETLCKLVTLWPDAYYELLRVLEIVTPFWIRHDEALAIAELALQDKVERLLVLNAKHYWTARSFICRACLRSLSTKHIFQIAPTDDETGEGLASLTRQLREHLDPSQGNQGRVDRKPKKPSKETVQDYLSRKEKSGRPFFIILNSEWAPDESFLAEFRKEFPTPTIIVLGDKEMLDLREDQYQNLPGPDSEREQKALNLYTSTGMDLNVGKYG